MQVLGIIGKFLSGPWMKKFYRSATDQINHIAGISLVKKIVERLNMETENDPLEIPTDFFNETLDVSDSTIQA